MPSMPWIKLYTEMLDDPKLGRLPASVRWHFVALCLMAGECDAEGYLVNGDCPLTSDDIAWRLRDDSIIGSMELLAEYGIMAQDPDNTWFVVNFSKRQGRSQSEKRRQWRERKQRQRDGERDTEQHPEDVTRDNDGNHMGVTVLEESREDKTREEGEDKDIAADAAPPPPQPAPEQPAPKKAKPKTTRTAPLTDGQRGFLEKHGAKRFKNREQAGAVLAMEEQFGTALLLEGASWTAKKGMTLGNALISLESALPNWGKPKKGNGGSRASPQAPEPKGFAAIRAVMAREGITDG